MQIRTSSTLALSATLACTVDNSSTTRRGSRRPPSGPTRGTRRRRRRRLRAGTSGEPTSGTTIDEPTTQRADDGRAAAGVVPRVRTGRAADSDVINNRDNDVIMGRLGDPARLRRAGLADVPDLPALRRVHPGTVRSRWLRVTLDVEGYNVGPGGHFFETATTRSR
jgi:hypothetical protein